MKANIFFLTILFAFSALLCKGEAPANYQSTDTLYFMGSRNWKLEDDSASTVGYAATAKLLPPEELVFTGEGILSYNLTTKEIVFTDLVFDKISVTYPIFNIYLNDTLLLENVAQMGGGESWTIRDLVLCQDFSNKKYYLCYIGPWWDDIMSGIDTITNEEDREYLYAIQKEIDAKAEKRKAGWDIFINYLSENGKIVGADITGVENAETTLPVQIYSAGKTIYVNNRTGKTGVVTVYSIAGVKIAEQTMAGQTTTLEIPVGGFYAVSVKAGNEKPVTAKLIVR